MKPKVICVDDEYTVARLVADIVVFCGYEPLIYTNPLEAAQALRDPEVKAIFSDHMMPYLTGMELLLIAQEQRPDVRRILFTAAPREAAVKDGLYDGVAQRVIAKPASIADVKEALAWL